MHLRSDTPTRRLPPGSSSERRVHIRARLGQGRHLSLRSALVITGLAVSCLALGLAQLPDGRGLVLGVGFLFATVWSLR